MSDEKQTSANDNSPNAADAPAPVSFAKDIAGLFTLKDKTCMAGMGVLLGDYQYMSASAGDDKYADHANAQHVYARLTGDEQPQMPLGGEKKWNAPDNPVGQKNLETFYAWMTVEPTYQP
jgi:hypothetical protein